MVLLMEKMMARRALMKPLDVAYGSHMGFRKTLNLINPVLGLYGLGFRV